MLMPSRPPVKPPRRYDASRRRQRALDTRARIVDTAEHLFLHDGYGATTISTVAAAAGVSVDTIYKSFGGKPGLIRAIRDRALEGQGPVPAEQRSDALHDRTADPRTIIDTWGLLVAEVAPRVAPVLLLVRDAAPTHHELRALQEELDADRHRRMTVNARRLRRTGGIRPGLSLTHTADVLWVYSSPELYERLVLTRGWTAKRYGRFVADAIAAALL